jgi:ABC-type branched-subunit amino acid transport system substrate-binding protein
MSGIFVIVKHILTVSLFISLKAFDSLSSVEQYAASLSEKAHADNIAIFDPDYTSFHRKQQKSFLSKLITFWSPNKQISWPEENFYRLLNCLVTRWQAAGYNASFNTIIDSTPQVTIIVWGSLHGAFHSLTRDLHELYSKNIINQALEIVQPHHFFVFNGDAIAGSPFILETLTLIMALVYKNPDRVFYIKGKEEDYTNWYNGGLKRELDVRTDKLIPQKALLINLVTSFFEMLPRAVLIGDTNQQEKFLSISYLPQTGKELAPPVSCDQKFNKTSCPQVKTCSLVETSKGLHFTIAAAIEPEEDKFSFKQHKGLILLEPDLGATTWSITSSPTPLYQDYFNFYYDAFCILKVPKEINNSIITLYSRDVRKSQTSFSANTYSFLLGKALKDGQSSPYINGTIALCTSVDLSKNLKGIGVPMKTGISMRVNKQNTEGGLHHKRITLTVHDDNYIPARARRNIEGCMQQDKAQFIVCPVGTSTLNAFLDLVQQKKILVLFPQSGYSDFRKPEFTHMVHFRASFYDEGKILTDYLLKNYATKNIVLFYQNDSFGIDTLNGARSVLKEYKATVQVNEIPYNATTTFFKEAGNKIKEINPDVIGFFSTGPAALEIIRALGVEFLASKQLYAVSAVGDDVTLKVLKDIGLDITLGQVVPDPERSNLQIVQEYRDTLSKGYYSEKRPNAFSLEAYIATSITLNFMTNIKGLITQQALINEIEKVKNYSFKGLHLNFNPATRSLLNTMWISSIHGNWIEVQLDQHI